ncbi:MAG: competence/damage-inducible protein A [Alphaproteobacteria bacterium]
MMDKTQPSAAFIAIGNELLSGRTQDKNLNFLALALVDHGIKLCEARFIRDDESVIIETVRELTRIYDYVFTSGGIGPTHDDITAQAVADAFGVDLPINKQAYSVLDAYYQVQDKPFTPERQRMARIPVGANLINNPVSIAPGFNIENLFVMAGVPAIFKGMVEQTMPSLTRGADFHSKSLTAFLAESVVTTPLAKIADQFIQCEIGCYPTWGFDRPMITLVVRSTDPQAVADAVAAIEAMIETITATAQR